MAATVTRYLSGCLAAGWLLLSAAPAAADVAIKVTALHIDGVHAFSESQLRSLLSTRSSGRWPWSKARYFDRDAFDADLERLRAFYVDHGYPDARVTELDARLSRDQSSIALTVSIDEGQPERLEAVNFAGFDPVADRLERLRRRLPVQPGDVLVATDVSAARGMAVRELQDHGYPNARVSVREDHETPRRVSLTLTAEPGAQAVFGAVTIDGNTSVDDRIIDRVLAVRPERPFSLEAIQQSQRRLYELDLFRVATVEPVIDSSGASQVPVRVSVVEDKHRRIEMTLGYGTEERLRAGLTWKHLNFFGGVRTATFEGKWSSLDRGVRASLTQPYVLAPDVSITVSAQRWFADEPAYKLDTSGGRIVVTREFSRLDPVSRRHATTAVSVSVSHQEEEFSIANAALEDLSFRDELIALGLDPRTGDGRGRLTALAFDVRRSTTSDPLDSRRGSLVQAHVEKGGGWLPGSYDYVETTGEVRYFLPVGGSFVVANRVMAGALESGGRLEEDVPFFKRYFLGGATSLRGWGRFEVAPLSGSGLPLGGHRRIEMSSELRLTRFGRLQMVGFIDAGNAWTAPRDRALRLRADAGPGVRYQTPVGPVRADFAYQLTPVDGLLIDGKPERRHWRIQFSIGQAF